MIRARVVFLALLLGHFVALGSGSPPPPQDLSHYEIILDIDYAKGTFRGTQTIAYLNTTGERLEEIFLRLYPNASVIYGNGFLKVEEVRVDRKRLVTAAHVLSPIECDQ